MKSWKQMVVLVLVVVVAVFVLTYVSQFVLDKPKQTVKPTPEPGPAPDKLLDFAQDKAIWPKKKWVAEDQEAVAEWEWHKPGHYDFWFENNRDVPVLTGLQTQSCSKCTRIEVGLVTADERQLPKEELAKKTQDPAFAWSKLELSHQDGITVPARAGGWIRLIWTGERLGPERVTADLWSQTREKGGLQQRLEVPLTFIEPVRIRWKSSPAEDTSKWKDAVVGELILLRRRARFRHRCRAPSPTPGRA